MLDIEEVTSYFHLGHRASQEANSLAEAGSPTAVELDPPGRVETRYAFGVAPIPAEFRRVTVIEPIEGGIRLRDEGGIETDAPLRSGVHRPLTDPMAAPTMTA